MIRLQEWGSQPCLSLAAFHRLCVVMRFVFTVLLIVSK